MLYVLICHDGPEAGRLRPEVRPEHLAYLEGFDAQGKVKLAGPLSDGAGSLIIVDVDSDDEARAFSTGDPYARAGVFERVDVHPFKQVFPRP